MPAGTSSLPVGMNATRGFDAHGHHRGAAHGESGQVGGSDNAAGAHERLARAQRGAGGPHARTGLDSHVVVERYRSVLPNDRLLDHHHGVERVGEVVSGVGAHVIHAGLPAARVGHAVRERCRLHRDTVERRGAHHRQRVRRRQVAGEHASHRVVERHVLDAPRRLPCCEEVGQRLFARRETVHDLLSHMHLLVPFFVDHSRKARRAGLSVDVRSMRCPMLWDGRSRRSR